MTQNRIVKVDPWLCAGHARCEELASEIFYVNDDGIAEVLRQPGSDDEWKRVKDAIDECPVRAILMEDVNMGRLINRS